MDESDECSKGACLGDAGVGFGEDHFDHVHGDGEEGPLLVHLLQQAQLAAVYHRLHITAHFAQLSVLYNNLLLSRVFWNTSPCMAARKIVVSAHS